MKNFLKGMVVGVANIIPGVSGGTMLVATGLYERVINGISKPLKSIKFFITLMLGVLAGVVVFAPLIGFSLEKLYVPTILLFVGLILGGTVQFFKEEVKSVNPVYVLIGLTSILIQVIAGVSLELGYMSLLLAGVLVGAAMIIPGISGSLLLLILGLYSDVLEMITELTGFDFTSFWYVVVFLIGAGIGVLLSALGIKRILKTHRNQFMNIVLGLLIGSIVAIFPKEGYDWLSFIGIPMFIGGYLLANKM